MNSRTLKALRVRPPVRVPRESGARRPLTMLLLVGLLAALGCRAEGEAASPAGPNAPSPSPAAGSDAALPLTLATSVPVPTITAAAGPAAPDPLTAVTTFASAELAGDTQSAWALLSQADRQRYPHPQVWAGERAQRPRLRGIDAVSVRERSGAVAGSVPDAAVEVAAEVRFDPALDQNLGMIPSSAAATWVTVPEDGGWRVAYRRSSFDAHLPGETQAAEWALRWARARQQCEPPGRAPSAASNQARLEVVGGVVGVVGLANRLCESDAPISVSPPERLDPADGAAVVAAFGPQSLQWAQVVALEAAAPQRVVMGPLGDRWIAIGVLAP